ncbi:MAG: porin [Pseudomonadota bacterium]
MKKSLLAACALLACATAAQAQSSVTVSGLVDMFAGSLKNAGDAGRVAQVGSGGMTTSWFGFTGAEDLGGGLKAEFKLTSFQRLDTGTPGRFAGDGFFTRDANVALAGGFGRVSLGRDLAPNFLPTILFNPFGDSFTFSPLVLLKNVPLFNATGWPATTPSDTGWSNEVIYSTPKFGGLSGNLHYQFGEQQTAGNRGRKNVGANFLWFTGPFAFTGYYERDQVTNPVNGLITSGTGALATPDTIKDWMLGGSYDASFAKFFLTYGQTKSDNTRSEADTTSIGASIPVGAGSINAALARAELSVGSIDGPRRTIGTIGYDYFLSKRTDLYANLMHDKVTAFNSGTSFGIGIRHRF